MKAEITPENKAKFFAQYWKQRVLQSCLHGGLVSIESYFLHKDNLQEGDNLLLTPLSEISDEDAIEMGYDACNDQKQANYGISPSGVFLDCSCGAGEGIFLTTPELDFLRFRGYALPWMGLTVDEMVEAGWIKIKD